MSHKKIHNLDTLDKEIFRLKLKQREQEAALRNEVLKLRRQGLFRFFGTSLFGKKKEENEKETLFSSFTRNENFNRFLERLTGDLTEKLNEGVEEWMERFFRKKGN